MDAAAAVVSDGAGMWRRCPEKAVQRGGLDSHAVTAGAGAGAGAGWRGAATGMNARRCVSHRALHGVGSPYGYGYGVGFGWIWIFFREKFCSGVGNGVKIPKCLQNTYCPHSFLTV